MAASGREDSGLESQSSSVECMPSSQHCPSSDSLPEWRSSEQVENGTPSTPPPYWDTDEDDDPGSRPSDLFGKYTWKIDDFSQINKRELRSNIFEIGGYKWYILIYPQGCDVCNHLSLFLCVANHDKLLPGWSHFAQFTIAVVNKDSKKSKYSDTLHRFWKKEHDWGWKKFMELSKVSDGFLVDDALVIKAQVQVIREKTDRPFRCLDWQYRRELVRVYLSNVEQLCRRFVEEKRGKFSKMLEDKVRWSSFHTFWSGVEQNARRRMSRDKSETILKVVVKHFFIENEVTSTLVMDYLYSGLKILECQSKSKKGRAKLLEMEEMPAPFVRVEKDIFVLTDDVLLLLQRAASEPLPPKDEKSSQNQNRMKEGNCGEELGKDSIERDERRLTELGRRTVEIFALNHIFSRIEVAYQEAVALRRQEELIREEEAAGQAENELKSKRNAAEKEKRTKKKQTKQKKGSRKGKDRGRDEKHDITEKKVQVENNCRERVLEEFKENSSLLVLEKVKTSADVSDMSDIGEDIAETLQLELEERDSSPISWDTDASEIHPPVNTELQKERADKKTLSVMDDSSSTCSTDSVPSVVMSGPSRVNASSNSKKSSSRSRGKNQRSRCTSDQNDPAYNDTDKLQADSSVVDTSRLSDVTGSCRGTASESEAVSLSPSDCMPQLERHPLKEEEVVSLQRKPSNNDQVDVDGPFRSVTAERSSPSSSIKSPSFCELSKPTSERSIIVADPVTIMESSSKSRCLTEKLVPTVTRSPLISKQEAKSTVDAKINTAHRVSAESRPSSAPLVPAIRPTTSLTSTAPSVPLLSRSASAAGRLGVDPSPSTQSNVIQSYRNAIIAGKTTVDTNAPSFALRTSSCSSSQTSAFSSSSPSIISSASTLPLIKPAIAERTSGRPGLTFGSVNPEALQSQCMWTEELSQVDATSSIVNNHNFLCDDVRPYVSGSCHRTYCLDEASSGLSVHHIQGLGATQDEFPHLDIINDLLNEEHGIGEVAANGYYHPPHHNLNQQYTFLDDASTAAVDLMSNDGCHFDQLDQYYDDRLQRVYGCSNGPLDGRRGLASTPLDLSAYMNGQIGGVIQNQWPLSIADHSVLSLGSAEANGYAFHLPDYSNLACGLNGYNMYRPGNGR